MDLDVQRRDPATGAITVSREPIDPRRVGIVVVDMWNYHWCKTTAARIGALVPRMNRCLEGARTLGMHIFLCPTDVADSYVGTPQYQAALAVPLEPIPRVREIQCPAPADGGGCTCGQERCQVNYGWNRLAPDLVIDEDDLILNDPQVLYSICRQRGVTHLVYMGVHTQICVFRKSVGLRNMLMAGFNCLLARDLTDAHGKYDPEHGITPDRFTADVVAHFERHLTPTINMADTMKQAGLWNDNWIVDPVRITPWGTRQRPHLFEREITVTLSAPRHREATIVYAIDGSDPTPSSLRYTAPLKVADTTLIRAAAFRDGQPTCISSEGYFAHLGPIPPEPDVYLCDLTPLDVVGVNPPQMDRTHRDKPLRLRNITYNKGIGVRAPNQLIYELKPEHDRFVARVGVDESLLDIKKGRGLAMYPNAVFQVFIDGELMAESPVMRISEEPWRFDVKIPAGSRRVSLIAADSGNQPHGHLANWISAGFVKKG